MNPLFAPVPLAKAYRLLNHGPTVLVSATHNGQRGIMAAAWNVAIDFDPPKVAVVLAKDSNTRQLVEASGQFVLNLPCVRQAAAVMQVGSVSGHDLSGDKFAHFGLTALPASAVDSPLLAGCVAWLECRLIPEPHNQQAYDLFLGEVVAAHADSRVFSDGRWHFEGHEDLRTLHYIAGGEFLVTGQAIHVTAPQT